MMRQRYTLCEYMVRVVIPESALRVRLGTLWMK